MKTALVLGAGGTVGLAYHAGALRALQHNGGIEPHDADLIVGTSAGAIVGAYLRAGWTPDDLWQVAMEAAAPEGIFTPSFTTPLGLARRALGTAYVLARSAIRLPGPRVPVALQRAFPAGMFLLAEGRRRLKAELPETWPRRPLWLCAVDVGTGRRVVLGRRNRPRNTHAAVLASCAIPGLYEPVRIGDQTLVDGGLHSSTNLDLVVDGSRRRFDQIVCIAPMTFDTTQPPGPAFQLMRRFPARQLASEAGAVRRAGVPLLLVRPTAADVRLHGANYMRLGGWDRIAMAAYESTSRLLEARPLHLDWRQTQSAQ